MKKVLILIPYFCPGYKSGGPQRTIENVIDAYGEKCMISVLTQNHDLGSPQEYEGIEVDKWTEKKNFKIKYIREYSLKKIKENAQNFDLVYSCGLFEINTILAIVLASFRQIPKLYVAPMGVFSEKALNSKGLKKKSFLKLFKFLGFFDKIIWSFTSENERIDAVHAIGDKSIKQHVIAEDLPRKVDLKNYNKTPKKSNELRVVFLSRFCPHKNLDYALEIISRCNEGRIIFDLYGAIEDKEYWKKCNSIIEKMPSNIECKYCGEVKPEQVIDVFSKYDVFLFPTKGENYGHVIYEALASGCIPIVSDLTPWSMELTENKCGKVISIDDMESFIETIEEFVQMDNNELNRMSARTFIFAKQKCKNSIEISGYNKIFI